MRPRSWSRSLRRFGPAARRIVSACFVALACALAVQPAQAQTESQLSVERALRSCDGEVEALRRQAHELDKEISKFGTWVTFDKVDTSKGTHLWLPLSGGTAIKREDLKALITAEVLSGDLAPSAIQLFVKEVISLTRQRVRELSTQRILQALQIIEKMEECADLRGACPAALVAPEGGLSAPLCVPPPPPPSSAPFTGTWRIVGTPVNTTRQPMKGTVVLQPITPGEGSQLAQGHWGVAVQKFCVSSTAVFFYKGTIVWDASSFFDESFVYFTDGPSTILLCTESETGTFAFGNFRDSHDFRGAAFEWNGTNGVIYPESVEGVPSQNFTATKVP